MPVYAGLSGPNPRGQINHEGRRQFQFLSGFSPNMPPDTKYTCSDYREEMRLLGLKKQLNAKNLSKSEKQDIEAEIAKLEKILQMD